MTHLITLQQIRERRPCKDGWAKLLKSLGKPKDLSIQVSFGDIAKSNDAADALWCARCIDDRRFIVSMIMPAVKRASKHTSDQRVHDCVVTVDQWLTGDDMVELRNAASNAYAAYSEADTDVSRRAAYAAACAAYASYDVCGATACAGAYADHPDLSDKERKQQVEDIIAASPLRALA